MKLKKCYCTDIILKLIQKIRYDKSTYCELFSGKKGIDKTLKLNSKTPGYLIFKASFTALFQIN